MLAKYWHIIAIVLVIISLIAGVIMFGNARYQAGISDTKQAVREQIAQQDVRNREKERLAQDSTKRMQERYERELAKRNVVENDHRNRAEILIAKMPASVCEIPHEIINERNAIRALGPS